MKTAARNRKHGRSTRFGKRNVFRLPLNESWECFCWIGKGRSFHVDQPKTKKVCKPKVESGARNLEAESIRSRAESTGGCVKLKTVTEIRRRWTRDTCRECFILYWILFGKLKLGKLKQKIDVVSFTFFQYEVSSTVLYATKALDRGSRQARKERIAVVEA